MGIARDREPGGAVNVAFSSKRVMEKRLSPIRCFIGQNGKDRRQGIVIVTCRRTAISAGGDFSPSAMSDVKCVAK